MFTYDEKILDSYDLSSRDYPSEPTLDEIANEWNRNVPTRAKEFETEIDFTYLNVIVPKIQDALRRLALPKARVLDIGCGLGYLTNIVSKGGYDITGIDVAEKAIEYAHANYPGIGFEHTSIVEFSWNHIELFDVHIANMILHNLVDINNNLSAMFRLLKKGGFVIASIPDPKLWFGKHVKDQNLRFEYEINKIYKVSFKIRQGIIHPSPITYIHRSLSEYNRLIENAGFDVIESEHPRQKNGWPDQDLLFCVWMK